MTQKRLGQKEEGWGLSGDVGHGTERQHMQALAIVVGNMEFLLRAVGVGSGHCRVSSKGMTWSNSFLRRRFLLACIKLPGKGDRLGVGVEAEASEGSEKQSNHRNLSWGELGKYSGENGSHWGTRGEDPEPSRELLGLAVGGRGAESVSSPLACPVPCTEPERGQP